MSVATAPGSMTFTFRPKVRGQTPLIIGIAGPTKSGKTYSAHRLAIGLANGAPVAMINAEGERGHQYADKFKYVGADIEPPYRPERYDAALKAALAINPGVVIIDSMSHMHDGPGGLLEYHENEVDRILGNDRGDYKARQRVTFAAWVKPKAAENQFIYTMLGAKCPVILCFRAKEKIKLVTGKDPVDLGWQPIAGERVAFETLFTVMLPPHSKGIPDLKISDMREPFDTMVPVGKPIDEALGRQLAGWAKGAAALAPSGARRASTPTPSDGDEADGLLTKIKAGFEQLGYDEARQRAEWTTHLGTVPFLTKADPAALQPLYDALAAAYKARKEGTR